MPTMPKPDEDLKATRSQWEDFYEGPVWKDFEWQLSCRIEMLKNDFLSAKSMDEVLLLKGAVKELEAFRDFPAIVIEEFKQRAKEAQNAK